MAYQIRYTDKCIMKEIKSYRKPLYKWIIGVCSILLLGGALRFQAVQDFLIPGDPDVTRAAFSSFTRQLQEGERFSDAATVFCRRIIESDELQ